VEVPAGTRLIFRFATPDVIHGLHVPGTNVDTAVIPGFVSEVQLRSTTTPSRRSRRPTKTDV
jgi:heme/copper-type cytochrome/quinol oxidase subunit 2